nr:hypothetical protein [Tianweitania sediminis]
MPDEEGLELGNLEAAQAEATRAAGGMLQDHDPFTKSSSWQMVVTDDKDQLLFTLRFNMDRPAGPVLYKSLK